MKTRKLLALALAAALFTLPAADALGSAINYKNGDVNFDGDVSAGDLTALARQVGGIEALPDVSEATYDPDVVCFHQWGNWEIVKDATYSATGLRKRTCRSCGAVQERESDKIKPSPSLYEGLAYTVNDAREDIWGWDEEAQEEYHYRTCTITGIGSCTSSMVVVPEKIGDYVVTRIAERAFADCTNIKKIYAADTVKEIGERAFYNCSSLEEATIPSSVEKIGLQIFYKCASLKTVYYDSPCGCDPDIGSFLNVPSLEKVVFGHSRIPDYICYNCTSLKKIVFSDSVGTIGWYSFYGCTALTGIYITDIAAWCKINFYGDVPLYYVHNLYLNEKKVSALNIPDSVKSVSNNAFLGCTGLTSVVMADSVINIGISAFSNCTNLTSVTIPDSVMSIGSCAFEDCTKLTSITYTGTKAQWNSIIKGGSWDYNTGKYVVHCKDGNISK